LSINLVRMVVNTE